MLWDTHMHTSFSGDSEASPESMIDRALELGLPGICFTDHLDYDYPQEPGLFFLDLPAYARTVHRLQETYPALPGVSASTPGRTACLKGDPTSQSARFWSEHFPTENTIKPAAKQTANGFCVCFGIELGLQPHLAERHRAVVNAWDFDFVIGSSHVVRGRDPYYPDYYEGRTQKAAYREYFESILENIAAFDGFDVYGHLDYVVRYGPNKNATYQWEDYADVIDEILRQLIDRGKGLEVNTAGFKSGLGHPNPTEGILCRYRELGGEIVTVGADAHCPEHIAYDFRKLPDLLKSCGFSHYTVFRKRQPEFLPLS